MEIKKEVIDVMGELNEEEKDKLASDLASKWEKWDDYRSSQISTAQKIMAEVYLKQGKRKFGKGLEWMSDVKLNDLYNIKRTKKSMLWQTLWSQPEQMFDVKGTNEETEQNAKAQKAAIVDSLVKMKIGRQYDKAVDNLYDVGEMIFKVDWEQRKKVVKRQRKDLGFVLMNMFRKFNSAGFGMSENMTDIELPYYENARVESINPLMFVFDTSKYKIGDVCAWDSLIKIYKRFETLENIKNNGVYKLTKEMLMDLEDNTEFGKGAEDKDITDMRELNEYGGSYAILYCHGDFKIGGKLYKNYIAEVLAGKYLIRFEENPMFINPFTMPCAMQYDPLTKRGISDLKASFDLLKAQEDLTNTAFDVQKLKANPPSWSDERLFNKDNMNSDGTVPLKPGKILKFKSDYAGSLPVAVNVSGEGISDLLSLCKQKVSDLTSVSNFMFGNTTDTKRTATELSLIDKGASSQYSKEMDIINQDVTMPIVEKVAELLAMFKDGTDYVYYQEKGKNFEYKITNQIRQAQYEYVYEDRNALENRKSKLEQLYQVFVGAAQLPELAQQIDWKEVLVTYIEGLGWDNTDKFFKDATPATQFTEQLNQIPPEMQAPVVAQFSQELQQMTQQYQQQQQQAQMQQQAQNQVEMDLLRQQYRQQAEEQALLNSETI
jgi:hypothetical protein